MGPAVTTTADFPPAAATQPAAGDDTTTATNNTADGAKREDADDSTSSGTCTYRTFYAIRHCVALKGPALFFDGSDCDFYLDGATEEDRVEFREFSVLADAVQYLVAAAHANIPFEMRDDEKETETTSIVCGRHRPPASGSSSVRKNNNGPKEAITGKSCRAAATSLVSSPRTTKTTARNKRGRPKKRTLGDSSIVVNGSDEQEPQQQQHPKKRSKRAMNGGGTEEREQRASSSSPMPPPKQQRNKKKNKFATRQRKPLVDWDTMFARLEAYKEKHGHVNVPVKEDRYLHNWIYYHRRQYALFTSSISSTKETGNGNGDNDNDSSSSSNNKVNFTAEQFGKLLKLGVRLEPRNVREGRVTWDERAREWLAYKTQHGNSDPPRGDADDGYSLGVWVVRQRSLYARHLEGKKTPLTQAQIDTLTAWGFNWEQQNKKLVEARRNVVTKPFDERFQELLDYKRKHGTTAVPQLYPGLGGWVHHIRKDYSLWLRGKKSSMTQERMDRLNAVGFIWRDSTAGGRRHHHHHHSAVAEEMKETTTSSDDKEEQQQQPPRTTTTLAAAGGAAAAAAPGGNGTSEDDDGGNEDDDYQGKTTNSRGGGAAGAAASFAHQEASQQQQPQNARNVGGLIRFNQWESPTVTQRRFV